MQSHSLVRADQERGFGCVVTGLDGLATNGLNQDTGWRHAERIQRLDGELLSGAKLAERQGGHGGVKNNVFRNLDVLFCCGVSNNCCDDVGPAFTLRSRNAKRHSPCGDSALELQQIVFPAKC